MPIIAKLRYVKYYAGVLLQNWKAERESYAQHGEDILVERLIGQVASFIDIGANDGVLFSMIKGGAGPLDLNMAVGQTWLEFARMHVGALFGRVESASNIADGPTRDCLKYLVKRKAQCLPAEMPPWVHTLWQFPDADASVRVPLQST